MILSYWCLNWFLFDWESRALCAVIENLFGLRLGAPLCYALYVLGWEFWYCKFINDCILEFWLSICLETMILSCSCHYIVLVLMEGCFGIEFVKLCAWQRRNSASFAHASLSRLSESCWTSFWFWFALLAQATLRRPGWGLSDRFSRLGENGSPKRGRDETCTILSVTSRPGEKFWVLSDGYSRLGESGLPKRVHEVVFFGRKYDSLRREELA